MPDLTMSWAGDLSLSLTGDLAIVDQPALGTERVLRRLLTNPGDYIWHPEYGAGLALFVGRPVDAAGVEALVRAQMAVEAAVAPEPEPVVTISSDASGRLYAQIRYVDSSTAISSGLSVSVLG